MNSDSGLVYLRSLLLLRTMTSSRLSILSAKLIVIVVYLETYIAMDTNP